MKFLVLGAGGIGCYYGACLLEAGHEVVFVARGAHLEALQQQGLEVRHETLDFTARVTAIDTDTLLRDYPCTSFDLILLTLKAGATAAVMTQLDGWLAAAATPILSLQNGVDNEPEITRHIGNARTLGGLAVRIGGHIVAPGQIEARGPAQIIFGGWPTAAETPSLADALQRFTETFNAAGIPTRCSDDIRRELWRKLIINNGVNPLSALTGLDTRSLTRDPGLGQSVYRMMEETVAAAAADGVELTQADADEMFELISQFDAIKTSMLVDREKGHPLELEGICGAVLTRAEHLGIDAPVTELVQSLLQHGVGAPCFFTRPA